MIPLMIVKIGQKYAEGSSGLCRRRHNSEKAAFCIFPEAFPPTSSRKSLESGRIIVQNGPNYAAFGIILESFSASQIAILVKPC